MGNKLYYEDTSLNLSVGNIDDSLESGVRTWSSQKIKNTIDNCNDAWHCSSCVKIGGNSEAGTRGVSIGANAGTGSSAYCDSVAIGTSATACNCSIAIGNSANARAVNGIAIGTSSCVTETLGIAIGNNAISTCGSIAIGSDIGQSYVKGTDNISIGACAGHCAGNFSIYIGTCAGYCSQTDINNSASGNVFIGNNSGKFNVYGKYNVAIGVNSNNSYSSTSCSVAIGYGANAYNNSVAIGSLACACKEFSVAIGYGASLRQNESLGIKTSSFNLVGVGLSSCTQTENYVYNYLIDSLSGKLPISNFDFNIASGTIGYLSCASVFTDCFIATYGICSIASGTNGVIYFKTECGVKCVRNGCSCIFPYGFDLIFLSHSLS